MELNTCFKIMFFIYIGLLPIALFDIANTYGSIVDRLAKLLAYQEVKPDMVKNSDLSELSLNWVERSIVWIAKKPTLFGLIEKKLEKRASFQLEKQGSLVDETLVEAQIETSPLPQVVNNCPPFVVAFDVLKNKKDLITEQTLNRAFSDAAINKINFIADMEPDLLSKTETCLQVLVGSNSLQHASTMPIQGSLQQEVVAVSKRVTAPTPFEPTIIVGSSQLAAGQPNIDIIYNSIVSDLLFLGLPILFFIGILTIYIWKSNITNWLEYLDSKISNQFIKSTISEIKAAIQISNFVGKGCVLSVLFFNLLLLFKMYLLLIVINTLF